MQNDTHAVSNYDSYCINPHLIIAIIIIIYYIIIMITLGKQSTGYAQGIKQQIISIQYL